MKKYLAAFLFLLCVLPVSAKEASHEDIVDLIEEVKYRNALTEAGHDEFKQSMLEIYRKPDVQAAIKSLPELTTKVELEAKERRINTDRLGFFGSVLQGHERRLQGVEKINAEQTSILGDVKTGLVVALGYIRDQKDDKIRDKESRSRVRDILLGFLSTALLVMLNWLRTRRRDKALEKIASSHNVK